MFLQNNGITDMERLTEKVSKIHEDLKSTSDKITKTDRRIDALDLHLAHVENHIKHKAVYKKYQSLAPKNNMASPSSLNPFTKNKVAKEQETATKKQEAYHDKHAKQIQLYDNAKAHFDTVMNGRKDLPVAKWQAEQKALGVANFYRFFVILNLYSIILPTTSFSHNPLSNLARKLSKY